MFRNREDAAWQLAMSLSPYRKRENCIVISIPPGGTFIGNIVAHLLDLPHDVVVISKIRLPGEYEYLAAFSRHALVRNSLYPEIADSFIQWEVNRQRSRLLRQEEMYHQIRPYLDWQGQTIIIIDEGMLSGLTMQVAVAELRFRQAGELVLAIPVASANAAGMASRLTDKVIILEKPKNLQAISQYYESLPELSSGEVDIS